MDMIDMKIARIRAGVKAIDLAKEFRISPGQFSKIENGYIDCPKEIYEKLEEIFKDYLQVK